MRGMGVGLGLLMTALLGLMGCTNSRDALIKPPPRPDEFVRTPPNDPRYDLPTKYPPGTLNNDLMLKKDKEKEAADSGQGRGGRFGASGGY
jgi:hypothetical protein